MESLEPLIHKLLAQFNSNATASQMLVTVDLMRNTLIDSRAATMPNGSVFVWLPQGFVPASANALMPPATQVQSLQQPRVPSQVLAPQNDILSATTPAQQPVNAPSSAPKLAAVAHAQPTPTTAREQIDEKPIVYELAVTTEPASTKMPAPLAQPIAAAATPFPLAPAQPATGDARKPGGNPVGLQRRDLNDSIAGLESNHLNQVFSNGPVVADKLVQAQHTRVSDLRKGLSINEKYQFVNQLFRGDEAMFERSLRTLNNFEILPEARYWMQRELVVKLGWSDEEELVQQFYKLVSRRFS
jgi:hypothetical protein